MRMGTLPRWFSSQKAITSQKPIISLFLTKAYNHKKNIRQIDRHSTKYLDHTFPKCQCPQK